MKIRQTSKVEPALEFYECQDIENLSLTIKYRKCKISCVLCIILYEEKRESFVRKEYNKYISI